MKPQSYPQAAQPNGAAPGRAEATYPIRDHLSFVWLVLAFALAIFSNGMYVVAGAAWLAPLFMLRFLRTQPAGRGLLLGYLASTLAFYINWRPAFLDAGTMFTVYSTAFALLFFMPYVVDRLLARRVPGFARTLVLPLAWVSVEYLLHLVSPLGTFFLTPFTQAGNLPLLQILSVTGMWSITFLIGWFASTANSAWEAGFDMRRAGRGVALYAAVLAAMILFGGIRLALHPPVAQSVKVAVLTTNVSQEYWPEGEDTPLDRAMLDGSLSGAERARVGQTMAEIDRDLLARTRVQARAGAKLVTWSEYNAGVFSEDEAQFLEQAKQVAREEKIYLAFPLIVLELDPARRPARERLETNKSIMITPEGEIAYQYVKHNLLIGWESDRAVRGPRQIDSIDTPYGRIASVICLDMDYPSFMRLAGQQGVDIMLSGAIDGTQATKGNPMHSTMASFRTIEQGFSLARAGLYGSNVAVDYQGRLLGSSGYYTASDRTVVAQLPTRGTRTIYAQIGDVFPQGCLALLVALSAYVAVRAVRSAGRAGRRADAMSWNVGASSSEEPGKMIP
jgi:apolipoprotein N-acyltransferase